jgi:hypothetical protein
MGMPGEAGQIVVRIFVAEIIQQQKWIELLRFTEAEGALELYTGTLNRAFGSDDLFDGT